MCRSSLWHEISAFDFRPSFALFARASAMAPKVRDAVRSFDIAMLRARLELIQAGGLPDGLGALNEYQATQVLTVLSRLYGPQAPRNVAAALFGFPAKCWALDWAAPMAATPATRRQLQTQAQHSPTGRAHAQALERAHPGGETGHCGTFLPSEGGHALVPQCHVLRSRGLGVAL